MSPKVWWAAAFFVCTGVVAVGYAAFMYVRVPETAQVTVPSETVDAGSADATASSTTPGSESASGTSIASYTLAQVALHASASDCWSVVNGKVYDVTSFIDQHPGGSRAITKECGKDASAAFNGERAHANQGTQDILATYYVGILAQ